MILCSLISEEISMIIIWQKRFNPDLMICYVFLCYFFLLFCKKLLFSCIIYMCFHWNHILSTLVYVFPLKPYIKDTSICVSIATNLQLQEWLHISINLLVKQSFVFVAISTYKPVSYIYRCFIPYCFHDIYLFFLQNYQNSIFRPVYVSNIFVVDLGSKTLCGLRLCHIGALSMIIV